MSRGIKRIFNEVYNNYELINHILTFGFDTIWRKKAARVAISENGEKCLDVCTGTGEMAIMISRLSSGNISVFASDFSESMLKIAITKPESENIKFVNADSDNLPFTDDFFNYITLSFAGRNLNTSKNHLLKSLKEFYRVLKPGGRFINLETSQPDSKVLKYLFHLYLRNCVKPLGQLISGSKSAYSYLIHSIIMFYNPEELSNIILEAGFSDVTVKKLFAGLASIHIGLK